MTVRLWDRETGELVRQLIGQEGPVQIVEFSADGRHLLTADFNTTLLWITDLADLINFACEQLPRDFTAEERALFSISDDLSTCEAEE